jgi:hypothetical protein
MANKQRTKRSQDYFNLEAIGSSLIYFGGETPQELFVRQRNGRENVVQYVPYANDDFRKRIARGLGTTSLLIGNKLHFAGQQASCQVRQYENGRLRASYAYSADLPLGGSVIMPSSAGAADSGRASALAGEKLVAAYYEQRSSVSGGAAMAEAIETIRGFASPAKALRKEVSNLYNSLRNRMYRSARRGGKDMGKVVGGTWLEWKFAVDPVIKDCNDAATAINKMSTGDFRHTIPIRGVGLDEIYLYQGRQPVSLSGFPTAAFTWCTRIDKCTVTNRAAIRVTPSNGEVPLAWQFGVGVEDIAPAVLEGIPWSWFVDYFVNVSSVVQAWSIIGGNIAWANRTVRNSRTQTWSPVTPIPSTLGPTRTEYSCFRPGYAVAEFSNVTRDQAQWKDLLPPLRARVPHSSTRWVNLAALSQMYSNLKPLERAGALGIRTGRARGDRAGTLGNWEFVTKPPRL